MQHIESSVMKCGETSIGPRDMAHSTTRNQMILNMKHNHIKRKVVYPQPIDTQPYEMCIPKREDIASENLTLNINIVFYTDGSCTTQSIKLFDKLAKVDKYHLRENSKVFKAEM